MVRPGAEARPDSRRALPRGRCAGAGAPSRAPGAAAGTRACARLGLPAAGGSRQRGSGRPARARARATPAARGVSVPRSIMPPTPMCSAASRAPPPRSGAASRRPSTSRARPPPRRLPRPPSRRSARPRSSTYTVSGTLRQAAEAVGARRKLGPPSPPRISSRPTTAPDDPGPGHG